MNLLKKIDSRFLMANFNFLNEIKVKLLNEDLLCKLNRRLEVLKCIESGKNNNINTPENKTVKTNFIR